MGFIERLRREREREQEKEAVEHQGAEKENQRHLLRQRQASQFFEESSLRYLLIELRSVTKNSSFGSYDSDSDSLHCWFEWDRWGDIEYSGGAKRFSIETQPNGTIIFHHGGFLGIFTSSRVRLGRWQNNKGILESYLEKAFRHPKTVTWSKYL